MSETPQTIGGIEVPSQEDIENAKINTDLEKFTGDRATRASAAVTLRMSGASYTAIAETLGYSSAFRARQAVERALAAAAETEDGVEQLRFLEARRLERLLQSLWQRSLNPKDPEHLAYVRTTLAVIDRHARLYGLDAPQQMVVHTPSTIEVQKWVRMMAAQVAGDRATAEEADIIDVEVVETDGEPQT